MRSDKLIKKVAVADNAKKANKLDLSSDQDLTIALMNLISIERYIENDAEHDFSQLKSMVNDLRVALMGKIVKKSDKNFDVLCDLLGRSAMLMNDGFVALEKQNDARAYELFDAAFGVYSMFWGVCMGLADATDVENI